MNDGLVSIPAVIRGAVVALLVVVPAGLAQFAVADTALVWVLLVVILGGFALGGYVAAHNSGPGPLTDGGLSALAALVASQGVNIAIQTSRGEDIAWVGLPMVALVSLSCGLIGAWAQTRRRDTEGATT